VNLLLGENYTPLIYTIDGCYVCEGAEGVGAVYTSVYTVVYLTPLAKFASTDGKF